MIFFWKVVYVRSLIFQKNKQILMFLLNFFSYKNIAWIWKILWKIKWKNCNVFTLICNNLTVKSPRVFSINTKIQYLILKTISSISFFLFKKLNFCSYACYRINTIYLRHISELVFYCKFMSGRCYNWNYGIEFSIFE